MAFIAPGAIGGMLGYWFAGRKIVFPTLKLGVAFLILLIVIAGIGMAAFPSVQKGGDRVLGQRRHGERTDGASGFPKAPAPFR